MRSSMSAEEKYFGDGFVPLKRDISADEWWLLGGRKKGATSARACRSGLPAQVLTGCLQAGHAQVDLAHRARSSHRARRHAVRRQRYDVAGEI